MLGTIKFVLLNWLALSSSYHIFTQWGSKGVHRLLMGIVLIYVSQIVFIESVLGALGILSFHSVFLTISALYLATWLLTKKEKVEGEEAYWPIERLYNYCVANKTLTVAVILCFLFYGARFIHGSLFSLPLEGDSIGGHLPIAADYLKNHTIFSGNIMFWYYPCNSELLTVWFLLPMRNDVFASLQNWPLLVVALCAIYGIASGLSAGKKWPVYGCLLFASVYITWSYLPSQKNDLFIAAFFLASLMFLIDFRLSGKRNNLIWAFLCMGLIVGAKYSGPLYCMALLPSYFILDHSPINTRIKRVLFPGLVCIFALGGVWYLRNWLATGSPLYPKGLSFLGWNIFTAHPPISFFYDLKKTTLIYHWSNPEAIYLFIRALAIYGRALGLVSIPILIGAFLAKRRFTGNMEVLVATSWAMLLAFLVLLVTPLAAENMEGTLCLLRIGATPVRFALPFLGLAAVFFSLYAERLRRRGKGRLMEGAALALIVVSLCFKKWHIPMVLGGLIVSAIFVFWLSRERRIVKGMLGVALGHTRLWLIILIAAFIVLGPVLMAYKNRFRASSYDRFVERYRGYRTKVYEWSAGIRGKRIALTGIRPFGFFGPYLENDVTNALTWENSDIWPGQVKSFRADLLVIGRAFSEELPPADAYAAEHGELFKPLYRDEFVHAYEVIHPDQT